MTTADRDRQRAEDESARPADDTSDEQVWNEIEAEEKDRPPEDEDRPVHRVASDAVDEDEELEPGTGDPDPADDDDQPPSDDAARETSEDGHHEPTQEKEEESLEAQLAKLQKAHEAYKSDMGRVRALQREVATLRRQIATGQKPRGGRDARPDGKDETREQQRQRLEKVREEYGDVAEPIVDEINSLREQMEKDREALTQREQHEHHLAQERYKAILDEQWSAFTAEHPDGLEAIQQNGDVFLEWIEDQPKELRDIFHANREEVVDGRGAALLVAEWKAAMADALADDPSSSQTPASGSEPPDRMQGRREQQLRGARSPRSTGRQRATGTPPPDSDDEGAWWDYWEERERRGAV